MTKVAGREEQEAIKHVQIRLPESKHKALSILGMVSGMNLQETLEAAVDLVLSKPDAKRVRELSGMKADPAERIQFFLENASPNFIGAVHRMIDAWYESQTKNHNNK